MDDKKMVQLFDGVDDDLVRQANEDMNLWLDSQEGVVVHGVSRRSPWKTAAASAAGIAAAFGVFALVMANAGRLGHVGSTVYSGDDAVPNSSLSGLLSEYTIENLDCENAVVVENAPISGQWQRMTFENPGIDENSADRMARIAEAYGAEINKDDILLRMWNEDSTFDCYKPLSEIDLSVYDDIQYTDRGQVRYNSMFYSSDDIYIEIVEPGYGWIELENRKNVSALLKDLGKEWDVPGVWRPGFSQTEDQQHIGTDDEVTACVLNGKTVKVADAVRNAQKIISESEVFPKGFDTTVRDIAVSAYENGDQAVVLDMVYTYDGVPFTSAPSREFKENRDSSRAFSFSFFCSMLTENTIDWIWFDEIDGATEFTKEDCGINVSRGDALKLVSQRLSQDETFSVEEILLQYVSRRVDGGRSYIAEPAWQLCITNGPDMLYAYVSAVDGTVDIFEEGR